MTLSLLDNEEGQPFKTQSSYSIMSGQVCRSWHKNTLENAKVRWVFLFFISAEESRSVSVLQCVNSSHNPIFHGKETSLGGNYTLKTRQKTIYLNTVCYSFYIFISPCKPFCDIKLMGCILFKLLTMSLSTGHFSTSKVKGVREHSQLP